MTKTKTCCHHTKAMNALQIDTILRADKHLSHANYLGVFACDNIPKIAKSLIPCCAVVNTQPHDQPGMHWVCFIKSSDNHGIYFDSYGHPPYNLREVAEILETCKDWDFNNTRLQTDFSSVCGQYTIFVLTHLARGFRLKHIINLINDHGDTYANDALIFSYIKNKYYDLLQIPQIKIIDIPFTAILVRPT